MRAALPELLEVLLVEEMEQELTVCTWHVLMLVLVSL